MRSRFGNTGQDASVKVAGGPPSRRGFGICVAGFATACLVWLAPGPATAGPEAVPGWDPAQVARFVLVTDGRFHVEPTIQRFRGAVTAVSPPNANGDIFSFNTIAIGYSPNEIRRWRLTFINGGRSASVFQVRSNTASRITIYSLDGPLNGIAKGDLFVVERVYSVRGYQGSVSALGEPDGSENVYSIAVAGAEYQPDELRDWRLTFISGTRYGAVFEVRNNTKSRIVVSTQNGPLNGIAKGDQFLIENARIPDRGPDRSSPAAAGN